MEHQDWNQVVWKKPQSKSLTKKDIRNSNYIIKAKNDGLKQKQFKIDNETENFKIDRVSLSLSKQIQQARLSKKMNQKELAQRCNLHAKIINDYESGKAIPNNQTKLKIQKALGVILKTKN